MLLLLQFLLLLLLHGCGGGGLVSLIGGGFDGGGLHSLGGGDIPAFSKEDALLSSLEARSSDTLLSYCCAVVSYTAVALGGGGRSPRWFSGTWCGVPPLAVGLMNE